MKKCPHCNSDNLEIRNNDFLWSYFVVCNNCYVCGPYEASKTEASASWDNLLRHDFSGYIDDNYDDNSTIEIILSILNKFVANKEIIVRNYDEFANADVKTEYCSEAILKEDFTKLAAALNDSIKNTIFTRKKEI